jgi:Domain of unknown function (DUF4149)
MHSTLKLLVVLLLGCWLGASVFFSFAAAPALFKQAKTEVITRDQAGDIAEVMLHKYFAWGLIIVTVALILSILLAFATARPRWTQCAIILLIVLVITGFSSFVWTPKVHQVRMERRANPSEQLDKRFGKLHGISQMLNLLSMIGIASAFVVAARTE